MLSQATSRPSGRAALWLSAAAVSAALAFTTYPALARMLERWVAHFTGAAVAIEPLASIEDDRWRWHVGLDAEASEILNALYRGEAPGDAALERLALLFRLEFRDPADAAPEARGRPVYLGLAFRSDRSLKMKPQNLLLNLPLAAAG